MSYFLTLPKLICRRRAIGPLSKMPYFSLVKSVLFLILILLFHQSHSQALKKIIEALASYDSAELLHPRSLSDAEKLRLLTHLTEDSVQFHKPFYEEDPDMPQYFPLSLSSLDYIDLDGDDDLDLIYSGPSGTAGKFDSKVFMFEYDSLRLKQFAPGIVIGVIRERYGTAFYSQWTPCCDSYNARIHKYLVNSKGIIESMYTVNYIGSFHLRSIPKLDRGELNSIENPVLYALPSDFRGLEPYFRERTREVRDSLRRGLPVVLRHFSGLVKYRSLGISVYQDQKWQLVITEIMDPDRNSLYERPRGPRNRYIGWLKMQ